MGTPTKKDRSPSVKNYDAFCPGSAPEFGRP